MKNLKFTFWLIGFGCGMVVSGIIGVLFTINLQAHETASEPIEIVTDQLKQRELEEEKKVEVKNEQVIQDGKMRLDMDVNKQNSEITPSSELTTTSTIKVVQKKYCEMEIPKNMSAVEICELLEEKGVISSSEAFLEYVKSQNMQSRLRAGKVKVPILGSHKDILDALVH